MYVVTGATGNTGSVVAGRLLAAGKKVRIVVRDLKKAASLADRGAEVVVADLHDESAFGAPVRDAEGVYLLSPPDLGAKSFILERKQLTERIVRVLRSSNVKHVVLLSSIAAQHEKGTGPIVSLHNVEEQLRAASIPSTFVRAAYFMENWLAVLGAAKSDGVLPSFLPAALRIPMVATRDIGETAARALLEGPRGTRIIELAGPVDATPEDVASVIGKILGRPVKVTQAPLDAVVPTFKSFGASDDIAALFREMYAGVANGQVAWEGKGESARGKTTLEEELRPHLL
jgi:uncharacterized protein YbjT (DUF2867 family)